MFACVVLALGTHIGSVPAWVLASAVAAGAVRLALAWRRRRPPPLAIRLGVAAAAVTLLYVQFRTFNGLSAGTALLAMMAGLKLLETHTSRDLYIATLLVYFLVLSSLLLNDSFWLLTYAVCVCWLTTATLLRLTTTPPLPAFRTSVLYTGKVLLQAVPLAAAFWLFFPRFSGPLWHLPSEEQAAQSGLGDSMSPGDITRLALSDDVAFRVRFPGATPPPGERYWRGPVLHEFDGRTWTRGRSGLLRTPPWTPAGTAYTYKVSLEPHQHNWVFLLDFPSRWDLPQGALTADFTLIQPDPVSRPLDVVATSYPHVDFTASPGAVMRRRDLRLPEGSNPRTVALAHTLRGEHPDAAGYVQAVLDLFAREPFYYTLSPPPLAADSVDAFLFDSRRGFCGHYASAFATLMRAAGIPARVVTGYQGGTLNPYASYWIVRQSQAHAWDEVWIDGRGWVRVDPTAAISPARVDPGLAEAVAGDESLAAGWRHQPHWLASLAMRVDAMRQIWRERILLFDQSSQISLLEALHVPQPDGEKLVVVLAATLLPALLWLTWSVRREVSLERRDPLLRAYARLCRKLARAGLSRRAHEGAEDFAARVASERPELAGEIESLCRRYSELRYGAPSAPGADGAPGAPGETAVRGSRAAADRHAAAVREFAAAVRSFRPASAVPR
jgi:transglutaminase-like putative cysteine protease